MTVKKSQIVEVLPITDQLYEGAIQLYWTWLLDTQQGLKNYIRGVSGKKVYLTRACYQYTNVSGINSETGRRNLCGLEPGLNHVNHVSIGHEDDEFDYILIPVLDTVEYKQARGASGQPLSQDDINAILVYENDAVTPTDMTVTIQEKTGQNWGPAIPLVENIFNYRTSSPLDPGNTFRLTIPQDSALADKMEFPLSAYSNLDARAMGYYLLVQKPEQAGKYQIFASSRGVREFRSVISVTIQV